MRQTKAFENIFADAKVDALNETLLKSFKISPNLRNQYFNVSHDQEGSKLTVPLTRTVVLIHLHMKR